MTNNNGKTIGAIIYTLQSDGTAHDWYDGPHAPRMYGVGFAACLGHDSDIIVDAFTEQDAIDEAADYAEAQGWKGYFLDDDDIEEKESEGYLDEYMTAGNHSRYLSEVEAPYLSIIYPRRRAHQPSHKRIS